MTASPDRSARDRHFDRVYKRIDELSTRVSRLERALYLGTGGLGTLAVINLITNIGQAMNAGG